MEKLNFDLDLTEQRPPTRDNLGVFLKDHGLSPETNIYRHIQDLATVGQLYLVGGTARSFFKYEIKSLNPKESSVLEFQDSIKLTIPNILADFEKALEFGREIYRLDFDLDLIAPNIASSYFMWKLLAKNGKESFVSKFEKDPGRYSISSSNYKIDVTDTAGNARLGKYATTFDSMILPVVPNLDLYGGSIYKNLPPILAMLGDATSFKSPSDRMSQAIAVRFITQSRMVCLDHNDQEIKASIFLGKNDESIKNTRDWLVASLAHLIKHKQTNIHTYHRFLFTIIPNWELFSEEIKGIIKNAFLKAKEKIKKF